MRFRTRRAKYLACIAAAAGLAASAAVAAVSSAATASSACQVQYTVQSEWSTGFSLAVAITNEGSPITSWTLGYSYAGNQQLTEGWDGTWTQSGENVTVTSASWNGSLGTGGSTSAGANFSYSGTNAVPATFTLNGTTCSSAVGPMPSPSPGSHGGAHGHAEPGARAHSHGGPLADAQRVAEPERAGHVAGTAAACVRE